MSGWAPPPIPDLGDTPDPAKPQVHIGYDGESMNINITLPGNNNFYERGLLEDCDHIEALTKAFEFLGCVVTATEEY